MTDEIVDGPPGQRPEATTVVSGEAVFIVHGQDESRKNAVARFVSMVLPETSVQILHEQPNAGRTLIEKLEGTSALARFAIIVLTADDEGRKLGGELQPRGRQNVIFEMGYFIGKFGRENVTVLYESGVELPSDLGWTRLR